MVDGRRPLQPHVAVNETMSGALGHQPDSTESEEYEEEPGDTTKGKSLLLLLHSSRGLKVVLLSEGSLTAVHLLRDAVWTPRSVKWEAAGGVLRLEGFGSPQKHFKPL